MSFSKSARFLIGTLHKRNASHIAFIGLGQMGSRMAKHLVNKGQKLKVFDVIPSVAKSVQGTEVCASPAEAARGASVVFTMLPNGQVVKDTVLADNGILKGMDKNALLVDSSTIGPLYAQQLADIAKENGIRFLDAPVSGGVTGAEAATLAFMVGGEEKDLDQVKSVMLQMGAKVFRCGSHGAGQIAKLCNNLIFGITMLGTSEALNLGVKLGLDPKLLTEIINVSTGRSFSSEKYHPIPGIMENVPSANGYKGGFGIPLLVKDLGLAESAAASCGAPLPTGAIACQMYRTMMLHGYEDKDMSAAYDFLKALNK